jgi:hypothetical protein
MIPILLTIGVLLLAFAIWRSNQPANLPTMSKLKPFTQPTAKHYQREAMSLAAAECFPKLSDRKTYAEMDQAIKNTERGLSKSRRADHIQGMLQTGMITQHSDGTYSRSLEAE